MFGAELGLPGRWRMVADAEAAGVALVADATSTRVTEAEVELTVAGERATRRRPGADRDHHDARRRCPGPGDALSARGIATFVVGDARAALGFEGITRDAEDVGRALAR